jgi:hypothetical protein
MSVMDTIFGRWELAVADKVYGSNVGAQTYNTYRYIYTFISEDSFFFLYLTGPGPQRHFNANHRVHKKNVAGEHGYKGGLNEDYLFSPRTGMDSSESEEDSSDDSG